MALPQKKRNQLAYDLLELLNDSYSHNTGDYLEVFFPSSEVFKARKLFGTLIKEENIDFEWDTSGWLTKKKLTLITNLIPDSNKRNNFCYLVVVFLCKEYHPDINFFNYFTNPYSPDTDQGYKKIFFERHSYDDLQEFLIEVFRESFEQNLKQFSTDFSSFKEETTKILTETD